MGFPEQCVCASPGKCKATGRGMSEGMFLQCQSNPAFRQRMVSLPTVQSSEPGLLTKAVNFAKAATKHIAAGLPKTPPDELERRRQICYGCDQFVNNKCAKCGCGIAAKTSWALEKCPIGKWELPVTLPDCTLCITYWNRPRALARLKASIDKHLPGVPLIVEDTGGNLSAGRNRLYAKAQTQHIVVMEEDFVVIPQTAKGLQEALSILAHDPAIMGVGGSTMEGPKGRVQWGHNFYQMNPELWGIKPSKRPMRSVGEISYRPCDLVLNWGVFRKALYQRVLWDEQFPIHEHKEYFWRASREHEFAFYWPLRIEHLRDKLSRPHAEYKRNRFRNFTERVYKKHGFRFHAPV